jgi:GntR family transcriptional regulator/MocR family aminotransferase
MLVLEDDYDGEFRYDGRPIAALQSLEPSTVIYAGTAAKALAPGLRLGWLAVPEELRADVIAAKDLLDRQTGALDQLAFAELLRSGGYDRHIRKMRLRYRRRRDLLLTVLHERFPGLEIAGAAAGLNLLLRLPDAAGEARALAETEALGVAVQGLADGDYYEGDPAYGLIVGYAATQEHAYAAAVDALLEALGNAGVESTRPSARISIPW